MLEPIDGEWNRFVGFLFGRKTYNGFTVDADGKIVGRAPMRGTPPLPSLAKLGIFVNISKKSIKGYNYVKTINNKYHVLEKTIKGSKLSGQARSVYQKVFNNEGKLIRMMKKDYKIDGRMFQNKPKFPIFPNSKDLK